jgi:hypothetical protein
MGLGRNLAPAVLGQGICFFSLRHENSLKTAPQKRTNEPICSSGLQRVAAYIFFVAYTFQIQPFHKGLAMQADVAFCFMPGA